jgi:hypothetical protein
MKAILIAIAYTSVGKQGPYYWYPQKGLGEDKEKHNQRKNDMRAKHHDRFKKPSDIQRFLLIHQQLEVESFTLFEKEMNEQIKSGIRNPQVNMEKMKKKWAKIHFFNNKKLRMARSTLMRLTDICM